AASAGVLAHPRSEAGICRRFRYLGISTVGDCHLSEFFFRKKARSQSVVRTIFVSTIGRSKTHVLAPVTACSTRRAINASAAHTVLRYRATNFQIISCTLQRHLVSPEDGESPILQQRRRERRSAENSSSSPPPAAFA